MFKKLFTASWMALLFTFCHLAAAATNVSVTATPSNPTAPAPVTLAVSGDADGNPIIVTKVEYFNGTTSLGVSVQSPFTLTLNNLAAGTYQISVKATTTDPANPVLQSAPLALTVGSAPGAATAYFIHTDQLNTPRAITDGSGKLVWQWDSDPFGKDAPNEQPAGQPAFMFNQRFPGQQFDRESNLHYNYFRDYDPALGRYVQSDPIGLYGGINTYVYVESNPLSLIDELGLAPGDPYPTANAAAIQAIKDVNSMSIATNLEIGGRVYRRKDGRYSYTWPALGTNKDMGQVPPMCPGNEGMYHTHGNYDGRSRPDVISGVDQYWSDKEGKPIWAGTPSGAVVKYTPNGIPFDGPAKVIARGIK